MKDKLLARIAVGALVAGVLSAGQAQAVVVSVRGQYWDVTTFEASPPLLPPSSWISGWPNADKFALPPTPGVMPWLGDISKTDEFARAVGGGRENSGGGPFFAFGWLHDGVGFNVAFRYFVNGNLYFSKTTYGPHSWAQATLVDPPAASAPGPLPALGVAAAFGYSRKLRHRIKKSGNSASNTFTL